jgi:hypothetical protein
MLLLVCLEPDVDHDDETWPHAALFGDGVCFREALEHPLARFNS